MPLPSPKQTWLHGCCSKQLLQEALSARDDNGSSCYSAIEADIILGKHVDSSTGATVNEKVAIMAHPPTTTSDLSFEEFIASCCENGQVHVKLDFKSLQAVQECMPLIEEFVPRFLENGRTVFLNADILPGPGTFVSQNEYIDADRFMELCREHVGMGAVLSLGWKMSLPTSIPYTRTQMDSMIEVLKKHRLLTLGSSIVFAVNARCVYLDVEPIKYLLSKVDSSQVLLWTGNGEPPTSSMMLSRLKLQLEEKEERTGYDVQISTTELVGIVYDVGCYVYGYWLYFFPKAKK